MRKTILILAANPKDTPQLRLDQEVREIENGLERAQKRDEFTLKQRWAARPVDVRRAMLDFNPNIVHFCGHGAGEEGIAFEDEMGEAKFVKADALAGFFKLFADKVECVVLNACFSEVQAKAISKYIPYVLGMPKAIADMSAIEFSVAFYDALGAGKTFEFAYELACNAIQWEYTAESLMPTLITIKRYKKIKEELAQELKQEEERIAKEQANLKRRQEDERTAKEQAELKHKQEEERIAREKVELKRKQEEEQIKREQAKQKQKQEEEWKTKEQEKIKRKLEEGQIAKEQAELKLQQGGDKEQKEESQKSKRKSIFILLGVLSVLILSLIIWSPWKNTNNYYEKNDGTSSIEEAIISDGEIHWPKNDPEWGYFIDQRDQQKYPVRRIGSQIWMVENLAFKPDIGVYWAYDNDYSDVEYYGFLYDWETAKNVCPSGWRLPTESDFVILLNYFGGIGQTSFEALKQGGDSYFNGYQYGYYDDILNSFYGLGSQGFFWSSTAYLNSAYIGNKPKNYIKPHAMCLDLLKSNKNVAQLTATSIESGNSVRCIQDK